MGCDIHLFVEKRIEGIWVPQDKFNQEDDGEGGTYLSYASYGDLFYTGCSYSLFAALANVRNYGGIVPFSYPRGLPQDISNEVNQMVGEDDVDIHSQSWFTLRELLNHDWTQVSKHSGWVDIKTFVEWQRWKEYNSPGPKSYSQRVFGGSIKHITQAEAVVIYEEVKDHHHEALDVALEPHAGKHAECFWESRYYHFGGKFLGETIPRLLALAGGVKGVDDVRIVFGFDN